MLLKQIQLALIHTAVAISLVPINSTLNRVMIKELGISATLVAILASLPYLFSPVQVAIGAYSDRHPILGWRRSPYILLGLVLCAAGVALAPTAAYLLAENRVVGLLLILLVFVAWGMGYNVSSVSYLSLASEISGEKKRSQTIAMMFFLMILGIIFTATALGHWLEAYSFEQLQRAFGWVSLAAFGLGVTGLLGLEPSHGSPILPEAGVEDRLSWRDNLSRVFAEPQARWFFIYLVILLAALLGQDVLLEPYAAEAFDMPVSATTRITSIWGTCFLLTLWVGTYLERGLGKRRVAQIGAVVALVGFVLITLAAPVLSRAVFYMGVVFMGLGTGLATLSNLSLMLDMTTTQVGLYIGAWGIANALSRLLGSLLGGVVRDFVTQLSRDAVLGYAVVFLIEAIFIGVSLYLLRRIDVRAFKRNQRLTMDERAALLNDAGA